LEGDKNDLNTSLELKMQKVENLEKENQELKEKVLGIMFMVFWFSPLFPGTTKDLAEQDPFVAA